MQKIYTIKIHSFVDLITNSSTEIYIKATNKTVSTLKKLIDNILAAGGSQMNCSDLFKIGIDKEEFFEYNYDDEDENGEKWTPESFYRAKGDRPYYNVHLKVIAKDESPEGKIAAKILSNLTGLFNIEAEYN